jgi:heat shock protein HtpX
MYISNPFYKRGISASDLFSTHPPLASRIRILRAMSGAGYADYEKAYEQVVKSGKVMGAAALAGQTVSLRPPTEGTKDGEFVERVNRTRETSDLMWKMNNYKTIECENCGTRLRLPPGFTSPAVRCPHCSRINGI